MSSAKPSPDQDSEGKNLKSPHLWVTSTYFAEGFPYTIVNTLAEILYKERGASLEAIGLTSLLHLPWNLKFIWGPLLDKYATKRRWLIWTEVVLAFIVIALALTVGLGWGLLSLSVIFLTLAFMSATHDIAIDGFYLEGLSKESQAKFVGYRATAYKIAALFITGPLIIFIGYTNWTLGLGVAFGIMVLLLAYHTYALPKSEKQTLGFRDLLRTMKNTPISVLAGTIALGLLIYRYREALFAIDLSTVIIVTFFSALVISAIFLAQVKNILKKSQSAFAGAYLNFLEQPGVTWILTFIVLFRAGESYLVKMRWPFLRDQMQMTLDQYGWANGTVGIAASFAGTLIGGWLISRDGLKRWLWPFMLMQNVLNLLYTWLAMQSTPPSFAILTSVISLEHFGAGLGTAVFMVFIMRCCHPNHKAAHMSLLTAFMSISFTLAGITSGYLAQRMGFASYFTFTFLTSVPAMLVAVKLPQLSR